MPDSQQQQPERRLCVIDADLIERLKRLPVQEDVVILDAEAINALRSIADSFSEGITETEAYDLRMAATSDGWLSTGPTLTRAYHGGLREEWGEHPTIVKLRSMFGSQEGRS